MYFLEPSKQSEAISIATSLDEDMNERTIEVKILKLVKSFVVNARVKQLSYHANCWKLLKVIYLKLWEIWILKFNPEIASFCLQVCADVLNSLQNGCFGKCPEKVEEYKKRCHVLFPYCLIFMPAKQGEVVENGPSNEKTTCNGSNETKSWLSLSMEIRVFRWKNPLQNNPSHWESRLELLWTKNIQQYQATLIVARTSKQKME